MTKLDSLQQGSEEAPKDHILAMYKGSLCLLFVDVIPRLQILLSCKPKSLLHGYFLMLCENLLKLSIHSNIDAAQFATLERIIEFVEGFNKFEMKELPELQNSISYAKQTLSTVKLKENNPYQNALNYGHVMLLTKKPDL